MPSATKPPRAKPAGAARPGAAAAGATAPGPAVTGPGATPRDTPPRGPGRPSKTTKRAERAAKLAGDLTALGMGLTILNPQDGAAVLRHAEGVAGALAEAAEQSSIVARILDGAAAGGAVLGVLTAVLPLAVELLANHGRLGAMSAFLSTPPPSTAAAGAESAAAFANLFGRAGEATPA